jgi:hypothetical protein
MKCCGGSRRLPRSGRAGENRTDIPAAYLPLQCR